MFSVLYQGVELRVSIRKNHIVSYRLAVLHLWPGSCHEHSNDEACLQNEGGGNGDGDGM